MEQSIDLLKQATNEIKNLRWQNELMQARLGVFDNMMALLNTRVERGGKAMSPDLVYHIEKFIAAKEMTDYVKDKVSENDLQKQV